MRQLKALAPFAVMTLVWLGAMLLMGGPGSLRSGDWGDTAWALAKYCVAGSLAAFAGRRARAWLR